MSAQQDLIAVATMVEGLMARPSFLCRRADLPVARHGPCCPTAASGPYGGQVSRRSLYVETTVAAGLDRVWQLTQDPEQHVRWDARFTRITPGHRAEGQPQDFTYALHLPGLVLSGTGTSVGERGRADGTRTSALRFRSDSRLSPISAGSGYWRYERVPDGVRFLTGYDYEPGPQGRWLDDICVRPGMGWLTAWSFDRLRLWAETGLSPEVALRRTLGVTAVRAAVLAAGLRRRSLPLLLLASCPAPVALPRARRCLRRPPSSGDARPPQTLATLHQARSPF